MIKSDTLETVHENNTQLVPVQAFSSALVILVCFFVYRATQNALFSKGYKDFSYGFHIADSVINSFLLPALVFFTSTLFIAQFRSGKLRLSPVIYGLCYLFVFWVLFQNAIEVVFSGYTGSSAVLTDIYFDLTAKPANHLWLIVASTVNVIFLCGLSRLHKNMQWLAMLVCGVAYCFQHEIQLPYPLSFLSQYSIFVALALCFYPLFELNFTNHRYRWAVLALVVFSLVQYVFHGYLGLQSYSPTALQLLLSTFGIALVYFISVCIPTAEKPPSRIYIYAVSIYLFHLTFSAGVCEVLQRTFSYSSSLGHLALGVSAGVILPICIAFFYDCRLVSIFYSPPNIMSYEQMRARFLSSSRASKWLSWCGCICIGLMVTGYGAVYILSERDLGMHRLTFTPVKITLSSSQHEITEGKRLASIFGCAFSCHGNSLEGKEYHRVAFRGAFRGANLTQSVLKYSDSELAAMIRTGLRPDGPPLMAGMPSAGYSLLSDEQVSSIIAFMRSIPTSNKPTVKPSIGILSRLEMAVGRFKYQHQLVDQIGRSSPVIIGNQSQEQGRRWALAACSECHGISLKGRLDLGSPPLVIVKGYTFEQFKLLMRRGVNISGQKMGLMTTVSRSRFKHFSEEELLQLYQYLSARNG